jgi:hypothetical protein
MRQGWENTAYNHWKNAKFATGAYGFLKGLYINLFSGASG